MQVRPTQHHFAGVKAAIALFSDARRQPGLLPDAETDMARLETVMGGFDREQTRRVVKGHAGDRLVKGQIAETLRHPGQVVGKLLSGDRALLGGEKTVEFLLLHQIVHKAIAAGRLNRAHQIFEKAGLHRAVRHHHARMPGEVGFALKKQRAKTVQSFRQRGDAEVERADAYANEIIRLHFADSWVTR